MSNNQKGNENTDLRIQALEDQIQRLMGIIESQQSEMLMSKRNNAVKTSTLDEEVTIIFNMFGSLRVNFATWSLVLKQFGQRVIITKKQLQELVNNKRGYFDKQFILLDAKHIDLAEDLQVSVFDSSSKKFIQPQDIAKIATMSVYETEEYYNNLSVPMKTTFINYCFNKCCEGDRNFIHSIK